MTDTRPVRWFTELTAHDTAIAGGKGANLGELTRAGFPVPPGFVITAPAYLRTMDDGDLRKPLLAETLAPPVHDPAALAELASSLVNRIREVEMPADLAETIVSAYRKLGSPPVAVRSSATAEDSTGMSFAGMNESFTNVHGESELLSCVRDCWASAYGARVIAYRASRPAMDEPAMAVVVQTMVNSERSGVTFSADPSTGDREHIVIEAAFGLGEVVAGGQLIPDLYVLDSHGPSLLDIRIGYKDHKITAGREGSDVRVELSVEEATRRVIDDGEVLALAELALRVQRHYGCPQDLEWAIQDGVTYLVQARSIPAPNTRATSPEANPTSGARPVRGQLVAGLAAAPGVASGTVRVLASPEQAGEFRDGEVLVAPAISPDWMPILRRAAALVIDGGGITCHAAIVTRELGIPSVVGARAATPVLHTGQRVTVDGSRGVVEERNQ